MPYKTLAIAFGHDILFELHQIRTHLDILNTLSLIQDHPLNTEHIRHNLNAAVIHLADAHLSIQEALAHLDNQCQTPHTPPSSTPQPKESST